MDSKEIFQKIISNKESENAVIEFIASENKIYARITTILSKQ